MKKVIKFLSVFLVAAAASLLCFMGEASSLPRACIDSPRSACAANSVVVRGWAVSKNGIKNVAVYVNNKRVGYATVGLKRPDVYKIYTDYRGSYYSGYTYTLNTSSYRGGRYTVKIVATAKDGRTTTETSKFTKLTPDVRIESPKNGAVRTGNVNISGWSINTSGVKKVTVSIDGKTASNANINISRPDVNRIKNKSGLYKGASNGGFSYSVSYKSLSLGKHTIKVTSYGNDGSNVFASCSFTLTDPKPIVHIDTNGKYYMTDSLAVKGWTLNVSGINKVEIFIGNVKIGDAAIGLACSDSNIVNNYSYLYKDVSKSGYSFNLSDTSAYPVGSYTLKVVATGTDGTTAATSVSLTKLPTKVYIDYPKNNTTVKSDFAVSGWAISSQGISSINVLIDGKSAGIVTTSMSRPDVKKVMHGRYHGDGFKNADTSGYSCNVDIDTLKIGTHKITVRAVDALNGKTTDSNSNINVIKASPCSYIDTPKNNNEYFNSLTVSGWSLNASGVKKVCVFLDNTEESVTYGLDSDSGIIARADGKYKGADKARFTTDSIDISHLSIGKHTVKIISYGNDGDTSTSSSMLYKYGPTTYTSCNITLNEMATGNKCTENTIDPNYIITHDSEGIYEFMTLNYIDGITADQLNSMLDGCGVLKGKGQVFLDAANQSYKKSDGTTQYANINPVYLAAHAIHETGKGTSSMSTGVYVEKGTYIFNNKKITVANSGTYYNQFGIKACDNSSVKIDGKTISEGSIYAASKGWNSVEASITGGAEWIAKTFIWGGKPNQDTLYEMKWDPLYWVGQYNKGSEYSKYEYATQESWAHSIAYYIYENKDILNGKQLKFDIPKYN